MQLKFITTRSRISSYQEYIEQYMDIYGIAIK